MASLMEFLIPERTEPFQLTFYVVGTFLLAVVINWVIQIVQLVRKSRRDREALKEFPGPKGHWFWGNLPQSLKYEDRLDYPTEMVKRYPRAYVFQLSPVNYTLRVVHPETIKAITATAEPKDRIGYRFLLPWIGDGLLVSTGHKWARNRRLLTPAFHFDILKPYVRIFSESSNNMAIKLKSVLEKQQEDSLELFEHVSLMTFDSLMKCIFGDKRDIQTEGFKHPYVQGVYEVAQLVIQRLMNFAHYNDYLYKVTSNGTRFRRACALVHKYSRQVIQQKREEHQRNGGSISEGQTIDFLDMLLQAKDEDGKGLTDDEIQAEVDTFMFEGHDTTASGISWCLYNLARHPEYQAKCRDEVNSVLGDREHFTWDDLHRLNFLTLCIKESLRLHPPVPNISRRLTKPVTFPDGKTLPAGMWVGVLIYATHHNPNVWDNPSVFDPYRFTAENSQKRPPHAYIPFSAGPRNCIGQHFALNEIKVAVGQVIRHMNLSPRPDDTPQLLPRLVIRAKGGLFLKVTPIEH